MSEYKARLREFKLHLAEMEQYDYLLNTVLAWERTLVMPERTRKFSDYSFEFLGRKIYRLSADQTFLNNLDYLDKHPRNDEITDATIKSLKCKMGLLSVIPQERYRKYLCALSKSEENWKIAKSKDDYGHFKESFHEIITYLREFLSYWGYDEFYYEGLISYYIDGCTKTFMEEVVGEIKDGIFPIVKQNLRKIEDNSCIRDTLLCRKNVELDLQEKIWEIVLKEIGFDFTRGIVKSGEYTTIFANSTEDVRLINSFSKDDVFVGIFNILHSAGKAIYHQNIDGNLVGTMLADPPSGIIKEAIGRFYENIIGKNMAFWKLINEKLKDSICGWEYNVEEIYEYINAPNISINRLASDEVTYLVHVLIRYEIEKSLIEGEIDVEEVPFVWKKKYKDYLNIDVTNDKDGVLQDVHWSLGYVGYFPTYLIANVISAQLANQIETELDEISVLIERDGLTTINHWLKEKIYMWGSRYTTVELVNKTCGRLDPKYYIEYLQSKYL